MAKREVPRFKSSEITQHFGFAVIGIENRMSEIIGIANCELRNAKRRGLNIRVGEIADRSSAKDRHQRFDLEIGGGFVECDADRMIACCTQVAPGALGAFDQIAARGLAEFDPDSVEEIFVRDLKTKLAQTFREFSGEIVDALGNSAQSLWSMINRIHRGDHS